MKNVPDKISGYLKETRAEIKKVAWPDRQYVTQATGVIIALAIFIGFLVSFLDFAFSKIIMSLRQVF
ncbi:preprotein translocase subunit SecE [Candidatus Margulisiibacteriota bacterium]